MIAIALLLLFLGLLSASFLWSFKTDDFLASESVRRLYYNSEEPPGWGSHGRVYTRGLAVIQGADGKPRFVKQVMLCDIGILD